MLKKLAPGAPVTAEHYHNLIDFTLASRLISCDGAEMRRTPGGTVLAGPSPRIFARITGSEALAGETNRWEYDFIRVTANAADVGWTDVAGATGIAYNLVEVNNDDSGVQGNGVNVTNLASLAPGMDIQPAAVGLIVEIVLIAGTWWFSCENGIDGSCT